MAFSINEIKLLGNLARDIELKYTPNGQAVATLVICTNRSIKKGDQWEDVPSFHRVTAWGKTAEWIAKQLQKGDKVYCDGRLDYHNYEKNGQKIYVTDIVADNVIPMMKREAGANTPVEDVEQDPMADFPNKQDEPKQEDQHKEDVNPDDIPF